MGGGWIALVCVCLCAKRKDGRGIPHRSAGVHVAEDRLLIERR